MSVDRRARLWGLLLEHARGGPTGVEHVCAVAITAVGVDAAAVAVTLRATPGETLYVSNSVASELEELTVTLGEGPGIDALANGPALAADLAMPWSRDRWPAFAPAAVNAGVHAMFSLPLQVGGVHTGVLDLYRARAGSLFHGQLADGLVLADTACALLLDAGQPGAAGGAGWHPEQAAPHHPEVHQATGMITVQLGVTAAVALIRLRAYAYAYDRRLRDVAADVVARRLRFGAETSTVVTREPPEEHVVQTNIAVTAAVSRRAGLL